MRPADYGFQDINRCEVCAHVFEEHNYDSSPSYFCTCDAPPRPLCMSVAMGECPVYDAMDEGFKAWDAWSRDRRVDPLGICSRFQPHPKEPAHD